MKNMSHLVTGQPSEGADDITEGLSYFAGVDFNRSVPCNSVPRDKYRGGKRNEVGPRRCTPTSFCKNRHTSSLSLPIKSSSGRASCRPPLSLRASFPVAVRSWSPWPFPRVGECGWDRKENTTSRRTSRGSAPSLFSPLLQTCGSRDEPGQIERVEDSGVEGEAAELSLTALQLPSSGRKEHKQNQSVRVLTSVGGYSLAHEY